MTFNLTEWDLVIRRTYKGKRIPNTDNWEQIPVQQIKVTKPNILVRFSNPHAPKTWYRASNVTILSSGIDIVRLHTIRVPLNELTLITTKVKDSSYLLQLWFPWWHEQIDLEVYQKDSEPDDIMDCLSDIKKRVDDISTTVL